MFREKERKERKKKKNNARWRALRALIAGKGAELELELGSELGCELEVESGRVRGQSQI